ncbi:Uncharacterized membrane protein, DUF4010 family [Tistlia consotensis]|uniref:Uncharacterized membrane protein, DUF4010 family n=1 Tax=Tistlia consotensis USBA 355 TaxID=560819 RepID=A0A1Y6B723_9PROT|nr:DUF4010 domain-containing protein [Tistlia consotensis]SME91702.1 Uncharacterized membrane protein, DUF4010 family [Tistlia consotensis USBA 355]SNR27553.1 Uncharacterized membrane protein, DUF4010 family [Tistlia consotensis]
MPAADLDSLSRLAVALAAGLLIGLERGWHARALAEGERVAGFRTFGLIGLLGGLASLLGQSQGLPVLAAGFLALGAVLAAGYWRGTAASHDLSATSAVAALVTFGLGAAAGEGELEVAGAGAVIVALLLGTKPQLHRLVERLEQAELLAVLKLLLMSVVLLPVLPDRGLGPWNALNPYRIWWMVVLIAGLSSIGYFAIRLAGPRRGILLTGLLGGLASSTATTVTLARRAAPAARPAMPGRPDGQARLIAAGILLACAVMFPRMLLVAAVIAPALLPVLAVPLAVAGVVAAAVGLWAAGREPAEGPSAAAGLKPENPFEFGTALKFGLLLAGILLLTAALRRWIGDEALYLIAAVSGLADVDAVTLSFSALVADGRTPALLAGGAILLVGAVNTLVKAAFGIALSRGRLTAWLAGGLGGALLAGAAAAAVEQLLLPAGP